MLKSDWFDSPDNYNYEIAHNFCGGTDDNPKKAKRSTNASTTAAASYTVLKRDGVQMYRCHCGREYRSKGSLSDHRRWECGKDPSFQCPYCSYCAKRKKHLRRHVLCVHKLPFTLEQAEMAHIECV